MAFTLWTRHLRHNPRNPKWMGRDRFILSGGHGSMLLYSLLHLTGYDVSLDDLKNFRQWGSITPGHPEYGLTPGVEMTTGPLGQGFASGVGMAIAQAHLAAVFNKPGHELIQSYIYAIVTDGDLMEGVASEAASLAGHLQLGRLIYLYDDNHISIDGSTELAFTENRALRFEAYGWHVQKVDDGNDVEMPSTKRSRPPKPTRARPLSCAARSSGSVPPSGRELPRRTANRWAMKNSTLPRRTLAGPPNHASSSPTMCWHSIAKPLTRDASASSIGR